MNLDRECFYLSKRKNNFFIRIIIFEKIKFKNLCKYTAILFKYNEIFKKKKYYEKNIFYYKIFWYKNTLCIIIFL